MKNDEPYHYFTCECDKEKEYYNPPPHRISYPRLARLGVVCVRMGQERFTEV